MRTKRRALGAKGADIETKGTMRTELPDATREEMLAQNGLSSPARWSGIDRYGHGPDDAVGDEPYDPNAAWDDPDTASRELEELGFVLEGGWTPVSIKGGAREGGITSHRGVLHPDEYVDHERLVALIEQELGHTFDDIQAVYRQGPLSSTQRELRGRIDARLLALSRSQGNMLLLARMLGWKVDPASEDGGENCRTMERALARAREAEGQS